MIKKLSLPQKDSPVTNPVVPIELAILMGTYEGQEYFGQQLESIIAQNYKGWKLWVSDDSAGSEMREVLGQYRESFSGRLSYNVGPRDGVVANYLSLACHPDIVARYYAFADQDDIWDEDKLERALAWLRTISEDQPALYCSRVRLVDEKGLPVGVSPLFAKAPAFSNALVQSIAGGNTMVFNDAARKLLVRAGCNADVVVHDWWVYIVVTGCGGVVRYDAQPSLSYRQHAGNLIGGNFTLRALLERMAGAFLMGTHRKWNDKNVLAVQQIRDCLTSENAARFDLFSASRHRWFWPRLMGALRSGIHRQTIRGNMSLAALVVLGLY